MKKPSKILYFGKKALAFLLSVLVLSLAVFYVSRLAPGDPLVSYYGDRAEKLTPQERAQAEEKLGLDEPIFTQYVRWAQNALRGDFGISYKYKMPAGEVIASRAGNTLLLGGVGFVLIFTLSLLLGMLCAQREGTLFDRAVCKLGTITSCIPEFWLSLLLILIFAIELRVLPSSGAYSIGQQNNIADRAAHLILPLAVVVLGHLWYYAYMIRNRLLDEMRADYVLLAKAKGLTRRAVMLRHCLRNTMPTYLSIMAISVPHVLGGTYIVEAVFSYPGLGTLAYESALQGLQPADAAEPALRRARHSVQHHRPDDQRADRPAHPRRAGCAGNGGAAMNDRFQIVGARPLPEAAPTKNRHSLRGKPVASAVILSLIVLGCLFCELIMTKAPAYLDLAHCSTAPCREFLFGTDTMGRDIFSMIWYGGRLSLFIGVGSTVISTLLAILFGAVSGLAPKWLDALLMRLTEILLSVPNLLLVIFLQAIIGTPSAWSIALVIGLTSWTSIAKVVRTEVRQLRASEYVIAAKCMGGSFFHILRCHLAPNFFSSILFMVVMNVRSAIIAESTLSFMGLGLPIEVVTWGSMLSLAEKALMTDAWWILLIPGAFLVVTLLCITNLGDYLRSRTSRKESNL